MIDEASWRPLFDQAIEHQRAGRSTDAEALCRAILARAPQQPETLYMLGTLEMSSGRLSDAALHLSEAATLAPAQPIYHANLGETYRRLGRSIDATHALLRALLIDARLGEPLFNLALILDAHHVTDWALTCFQEAARLLPGSALVRERLARARRNAHQRYAVAPSEEALAVVLAFANYSQKIGKSTWALDLFGRLIVHQPDSFAVLNDWANVLTAVGRHDEAIRHFRRALVLCPDQPLVLSNLAVALSEIGGVTEAVDLFRASIAQLPRLRPHSNLLFLMAFDPRATAADILTEAQKLDRQHAQPLAPTVVAHGNDHDPERRLRVGYVSGDFRGHCQAQFTLPLFTHHDRRQVELYCYSTTSQPDELTRRLADQAHQWRALSGVDEARVADRISADGIDILVDLTMHMARSHVLVFARKPAPVQVCWLAYPGTTGLSAIDYRLTDPYLDPPGTTRLKFYSEESIWLPDTFWCYDSLIDAATLPVGPLPALTKGHLTFGALNNCIKLNDAVVALWARVLHAVDDSTIVVYVPPAGQERVAAQLVAHGIERRRVAFVDRRTRDAYLAGYHDIDVSLDTFPYNGHTTSLDAWWMGVPVVTLVGETIVGRAGLCQAHHLGVPELVARDADQYVAIAVGLCTDLPRLAALRAQLRAKMAASPLMDAPRFARNIEAAYRQMWRRWCLRHLHSDDEKTR